MDIALQDHPEIALIIIEYIQSQASAFAYGITSTPRRKFTHKYFAWRWICI